MCAAADLPVYDETYTRLRIEYLGVSRPIILRLSLTGSYMKTARNDIPPSQRNRRC
jgi:hypothetical protein